MSTFYLDEGTEIKWCDSGGTYTFTLNDLATASARKGPAHNWGSATIPQLCVVTLAITMKVNSAASKSVDLYFACKTNSGADYEGGLSAGDASWSYDADIALHLTHIMSLPLDISTNKQVKSCLWTPKGRLFFPVLYNGSDQNLEDTANVSYVAVTPLNPVV